MTGRPLSDTGLPPSPAHADVLEASFHESHLSRKISLCQESIFFMRGAAGRLLEHTQTPVSTILVLAIKEAMRRMGVAGRGESVCVISKERYSVVKH